VSATDLKERLRADLKTAMRERKPGEVAVIRTLIAAIDNAEAVPIDGLEERLRQREAIGEVARRELDAAALDAVLAKEIESRLAAAEDYERHGRNDDAARLRQEAELVARYRR
jgi:uncharacterized protein YqeY